MQNDKKRHLTKRKLRDFSYYGEVISGERLEADTQAYLKESSRAAAEDDDDPREDEAMELAI